MRYGTGTKGTRIARGYPSTEAMPPPSALRRPPARHPGRNILLEHEHAHKALLATMLGAQAANALPPPWEGRRRGPCEQRSSDRRRRTRSPPSDQCYGHAMRVAVRRPKTRKWPFVGQSVRLARAQRVMGRHRRLVMRKVSGGRGVSSSGSSAGSMPPSVFVLRVRRQPGHAHWLRVGAGTIPGPQALCWMGGAVETYVCYILQRTLVLNGY